MLQFIFQTSIVKQLELRSLFNLEDCLVSWFEMHFFKRKSASVGKNCYRGRASLTFSQYSLNKNHERLLFFLKQDHQWYTEASTSLRTLVMVIFLFICVHVNTHKLLKKSLKCFHLFISENVIISVNQICWPFQQYYIHCNPFILGE